jgi:DNA-binding Xre family transcriptional regulator
LGGGLALSFINIKLQRILDERKITQKQLSKMTEIRAAAISELCNNQRTTINKEHLSKIADALDIVDIGELIELKKDT